MLSRTLRPAVRATSLVATPIRSNRFFGPAAIRMLTNTTEATPDSTTTTEPTTNTAPTETPTETTTETIARPQLPYFVGRNTLNNLGVYQKNKRGGNLRLTILKNGEGDLPALRKDIRDALQLEDKDIFINSVTKHVMIKGHKRDEVVNFLHTIGF
ncbi:mitochondrial large subunit ribosomal protein-domain-containing protein [Xylaria intraflava]|nr:mitochondrial large subunit ribosomal protein-domain-containing protein [Xylaria intraflava]